MHTGRGHGWWHSQMQQKRGTAHAISHAQGSINDLRQKTHQAESPELPIEGDGLGLRRMEELPNQPSDDADFQGKDDVADVLVLDFFQVLMFDDAAEALVSVR